MWIINKCTCKSMFIKQWSPIKIFWLRFLRHQQIKHINQRHFSFYDNVSDMHIRNKNKYAFVSFGTKLSQYETFSSKEFYSNDYAIWTLRGWRILRLKHKDNLSSNLINSNWNKKIMHQTFKPYFLKLIPLWKTCWITVIRNCRNQSILGQNGK